LTSVTETRARTVNSYYIDGIKYQDHAVPGAYAARLQAFTYPKELDGLIGSPDFVPGVTLYDQRAQPFHLSYRTTLGNDLEGMDYGYRIHIVYNVTATPSDAAINTVGSTATATTFEWQLYGVPAALNGVRPTNHISLDTHTLDPTLLETLETFLYGSSTEDPSLPGLVVLLGLIHP
jgi:hypothetical protein